MKKVILAIFGVASAVGLCFYFDCPDRPQLRPLLGEEFPGGGQRGLGEAIFLREPDVLPQKDK